MRTRLSICNRKVRYRTAEEALAAIQSATITLRHYRCDRCGQYHLTSRTKGKRVPRSDKTNESTASENLATNAD